MEKGEVQSKDHVEEKDPVQEEYFDSLQQFYRPENKAPVTEEVNIHQPSLQPVEEEESKRNPKLKENDEGEKIQNKSDLGKEAQEGAKKPPEKKRKKTPNQKEEDPTYILQTAFQTALDKLSTASTKETVRK
jgi:hypothetical protein